MARNTKKINASADDGNTNYRSPMQRHDMLKAMAIDTSLSDRGVRAAIALLDYRNNETGQLDPRIEKLASKLGWSRSKTERAIDDLKDSGWVKINHRFYASGSQTSNQYEFCFERLNQSPPCQIGQEGTSILTEGGTSDLTHPGTSDLTYKLGGELEPSELNPDNSHDGSSRELAGTASELDRALPVTRDAVEGFLAHLERIWPEASDDAEYPPGPTWRQGATFNLRQLRNAGHSFERITQVAEAFLSYRDDSQWSPGLGKFLANQVWEMLDPTDEAYVPPPGGNDNQPAIATACA